MMNMVVYTKGVLVRLDQTEESNESFDYDDIEFQEEKQVRLNMPFKFAEQCFYTQFSQDVPMLILQGSLLDFVGFIYQHDRWERHFTMPSMQYNLTNVFGNFLIGLSLHDRQVKLLELSGRKDEGIVNDIHLSERGGINYTIESYDKMQSFAVDFEKQGNTFTW